MSLVLQDKLVLSPETAEHLQEEIDTLQAATDVADIVDTYADLQNYDTSSLTDNAIVKVLADETHDDAQSYYRYAKSSDSFSYIGSIGPYYTKSEDDALLAAKQDTLVNQQNIKSVNGNSLLGSGNLELSQYLNFPSSWPTTSATTTKAFCDAVAADTTAIQGKMYLGEVRWSDLPADMVNAEVTVSIMYGNTAQTKVIVLEMTSGNQAPYRWQYTYWNNGSSVSDWIGFVPVTGAPNRIYGTSSGGDQSTYSVAKTNASVNAIVQRDSAGCAYVATPTVDGHAATKKYVDDADSGKVDKTSTANQVYSTNDSGSQITLKYDVQAVANTIVQRTTGGQVIVNQTPTSNIHATSKKYVDDALANKQNNITVNTITGYTITVDLADNNIYNITTTGITSLTVNKPANPDVTFTAEVDFTWGNITDTAVVGNDIVWLGDNVNEDIGFVPRSNCRYTVVFAYDGVNFYGLVRGISL